VVSILENAKYEEWKDTHNFENCKLERSEYGEFLADYLVGERDGFVLNLNGSWGAGKTEFLKRMYTHFLSKNHPVIYIDAWESDFSKDPLTVVSSELLTQIVVFNSDIGSDKNTKRLTEFLGKAIKATAVGIAGYASKQCFDDSTIGSNALMKFFDESPEDFMKKLTIGYSEQIDAIKKIRESLSQLANVLNTNYSAEIPVIVLIDELDRCRPTYAIEMLEVIKHFFKTDNFVFVIATDTEQLSHSIKAVYGEGFDSKQYLKRFFDRKATLPEPDIERYLCTKAVDCSRFNKLNLFPQMQGCNIEQSINKTISLLAIAYDLHIRDIDQLMNKFLSCLRSANNTLESTKKNQYINFPALLIGLVEHDKSQEVYDARTKFNSPEPLIKKADYKIADDFLLIDFIKQSMNNITFIEKERRDEFGDLNYEHMLPRVSVLREEKEESITYIKEHFITQTMVNIRFGHTEGQHKYWNWEDMKRVIELAGTIE